VWTAYFILVFNLGSLNTLRGHVMFEFFPAAATLASFAFLVMTFVVSRRFFGAVLVMFATGLLMAAYLLHAFLFFAVSWWLVLNAVGLTVLRGRPAHPCRNANPQIRTSQLCPLQAPAPAAPSVGG
jgi:hypothetical protein